CTHRRRTQFALLKGLARGSYLRKVLAWTIVTSSAKCSVIHRTINRQRIQFIINSQLLRKHAQPSDTICTAERPRKGLLSAQSARVDDRNIVSKVLSHPSHHQSSADSIYHKFATAPQARTAVGHNLHCRKASQGAPICSKCSRRRSSHRQQSAQSSIAPSIVSGFNLS